MHVRLTLALTLAAALACSLPVRATDWPVFGFDPARSGFNRDESTLTPGNVAQLRSRWQTVLETNADSAPILIESVTVAGKSRAMLYLTDTNGTTYGIDAVSGRIVWRFHTRGGRVTQSTPAMDPGGTAIYVPGSDGYVRKVDAATGKELAAPGFPVRITRMVQTEKDASPLNVANGFLYAATSGYDGDAPPYDGHVVAVRLSNGAKRVFNSLCSNLRTLPLPNSCGHSDSGIWGRGGVVSDPDPAMKGAIFAATGNGHFDANSGGKDYGDSVISLTADAGTLLGNYTPKSYQMLDDDDVDLGSTSPALIPRQPGSRTPLMLVQGGKDAVFRLVNRNPLPGVAHEIQTLDIGGGLFSTPSVWTGPSGGAWVYLGLSQSVEAYRVVTDASGRSKLAGAWRSTAGQTNGEGTTPVIANGMVFVAMDGAILALNAQNGHVLWSSANAGRSIGGVHWQSPIVVNGWVYCADQNNRVTAYALPPALTTRGRPYGLRSHTRT